MTTSSRSRSPNSRATKIVARQAAHAAEGVGDLVKRARVEAGLSQTQLGDALGYKPSMISALESGERKLKLEDLTKLCVILDKEPEFFLRTSAVRRAHRDAVGLTLRAEVAALPHPPLAKAISAFLDEVDDMPPLGNPVPDLGHLKPEAAARALLEECRIEEPPARLKDVAEYLGLPLLYRKLPDALSALVLEVDDGEYVVGVNAGHHVNRRRFSIAHELGHAVLRHDAGHYLEVFDPAFGEAPNQHYPDEREANAFAAALLMDARWLKEDWVDGLRSVASLAKRYWVSREAMSFRLVNLGLTE